jgi:hypothetical protein
LMSFTDHRKWSIRTKTPGGNAVYELERWK